MTSVLEVAERFLQEELTNSGHRFDPVDRARFHRLVRICAENWTGHPRANLRLNRGKAGLTLIFEGPVRGEDLPIFSLRVDFRRKEYRFSGPVPERKQAVLDEDARQTFDRLRELYGAVLVNTGTGQAVTALLRGKPFPDLVPLVEESRRVLDGGLDGLQPIPPPPRKVAGEDAPSTQAAAAAAIPGLGEFPTAAKGTGLVEIVLTCPSPKDSAAFYRRLFNTKSVDKTRPEAHAVFQLGDVALVLREDLDTQERRMLGIGTTCRHRGWGATFTIRVPDFAACVRRAKRIPDVILRHTETSLLVRDPGGYVLELVPVDVGVAVGGSGSTPGSSADEDDDEDA